MTNAIPAVEVRGLRHRYGGGQEALRGVSFSVAPGELVALLGPNGGGKTTAFRILSTMMAPSQGEARVFGHDAAAEPDAVRALIGVVFQYPSLDRELRVSENLQHHGHLYGLRGAELSRRIAESLARMGLAERAGDLVKNLSGGQRRRVELAKVFLTKPRLLLLDEPSTGLDPGARHDLMQELQRLRREDGLSVLLTTHFMEEAERCDRAVILHEGQVVAEGSPAALKSALRKDVVTVETDEPEALADELASRFGVAARNFNGALRMEHERGHEFAAKLAETFPGRLRGVSFGKPTLEDVFLERTGKRFWTADAEADSP